MAIPDFQTLMLPLLTVAGDGQEHTLRELIDTLAQQFGLTDQERSQLLPSGLSARFDNRVGWARTDLKIAGCLESTGRGKVRITGRGREVLRSGTPRINRALLQQHFPEYREYLRRSRIGQRLPGHRTAVAATMAVERATPEETPESAHQVLRRTLTVAPKKNGTRELGPPITLNINIQLTLPNTTDEAVYEKLFSALKKNLLQEGSHSA